MAIKARLEHRPETRDGQNRAPRRALRLETSGHVVGAGEANVTVHNISASGLLLETSLELAVGEQLALELPEAGTAIAAVVWRSERLYGCAFAEAIGPAALAAAQLQGIAPGVESDPLGVTSPAPAGAFAMGEVLGTRINRLRREAGLTLADVAAALGVSKPTVWAWEKGKARPLPERLGAIAAALGVEPDQLLIGSAPREADAVVEDCRQRIAEACGTAPAAVKIMIEL